MVENVAEAENDQSHLAANLTKLDEAEEDEKEEEEPSIGALFQVIESRFEEEISKSKKTLIDAKVLIQTLRKDFSRFEEIHVLRSTVEQPMKVKDVLVERVRQIIDEPDEAPSSGEKAKVLDEMLKANARRRREILGRETFEPIDIEYCYEDAVLYDSECEPINFEKPEDDELVVRRDSSFYCRRESTIPSEAGKIPSEQGMDSPRVTPQHRGSICYSHKSSPHPHRHPPRVDETVGMAISDDEEDGDKILVKGRPSRIYQGLLKGDEMRLDADESRMVLSESGDESDEQDGESDAETVATNTDTPVLVSSVKSVNDERSSDEQNDEPIEIVDVNSSTDNAEQSAGSIQVLDSSQDSVQIVDAESVENVESGQNVQMVVDEDEEFNAAYDNHSRLMEDEFYQPTYAFSTQFDEHFRPPRNGDELYEMDDAEFDEHDEHDDHDEDEAENEVSYYPDEDEHHDVIRCHDVIRRPQESDSEDEVICLDSD